MKDIWEEREKALENEYFHKKQQEQIEKMRASLREEITAEISRNRCPKCGQALTAMTFRGVPLDKCTACGGIWLGPKDLHLLAEKDHRTWFDKWFKAEEE